MRQVARKGLITVAAAGGVLAAMSGGAAQADAGAQGSSQGSPGVLSGNSVEVPVDVPVNACGNTVNVIGALNPSSGNACAHQGGSGSGAGAAAETGDSPGVGSGNSIQAPVDVPVNACGNSVDVVGVLNPVSGNGCDTDGGNHTPDGQEQPESGTSEPEPEPVQEPVQEKERERPGGPDTQLSSTASVSASSSAPELAETGGGQELGAAGALGAGLMAGGYVLYRRARAMQR